MPLIRPLRYVLALALLAGMAAGPTRAQNHRYEQIAIAQPQDQATVFNNGGHVDVRILVSPAPPAPGDRVELFLDGRPVPFDDAHGFALDNVDRGTHTLQARIVDAGGTQLIASSPVTFFMWQASRNFPSRRH